MEHLTLSLARLRLELRSGDTRLRALTRGLGAEPVQRPLVGASAVDDTVLRLDLELADALELPVGPPLLTVEGAGAATEVRLRRSDMDLCWSPARGVGGGLVQADELSLRGLVQLCVATLLPHHGGLAVHGATLVRGDRAHLFPAASGVGKSTLVRLSGGDPALSDEISLLRRLPSADAWQAFPSPFWSRDPAAPCRPIAPPERGFPLAGVTFIEQADAPWRRAVSTGQAVDMLLPHCLVYGADRALAQAVLDRSAELSQAAPAQRLGLPLGPSVWELLGADLPRDLPRELPCPPPTPS